MAVAKKSYVAKCRIEDRKDGIKIIIKAGDTLELTDAEAKPLLHLLTPVEVKAAEKGE